MPFLSATQRRAGRELGSASAVADSKQTLLCTYLSAVLLVGLLANSLLGWTWADPVAALVIAAVAVKEGREAWHGRQLLRDAHRRDRRSGGAGWMWLRSGLRLLHPGERGGHPMTGCGRCRSPRGGPTARWPG